MSWLHRKIIQQCAAIGVPALALGLLLVWSDQPGAGRAAFLVALSILLLPALAPNWPDPRGDLLVRGIVGLVAAFLASLPLIQTLDLGAASLTLLLWLGLTLGCYLLTQAGSNPRVAQGMVLAQTAGLVALWLAFRQGMVAALVTTLQSALPWVTVAIIGLGVVLLGRLPWRLVQGGAYAVAIAALAICWQWGGPLGLVDMKRISVLDQRAVELLPVVIGLGGVLHLALLLLLPQLSWRRALQRDLCAQLLLLGLPLVAQLLPLRNGLYFEGDYRVAWLALFVVTLLLARLTLAGAMLIWAAAVVDVPLRAQGARLALALFLVCLTGYWSASLWRIIDYGLIGDEPSYLAATISLVDQQNLDLATAVFSPTMSAVVSDPTGERDLHSYEDTSADRMFFSRNFGTPRRDLYLPLVAAPGMTSAVELVNPDLESAGGNVSFRDATGTVVETRPVVVEPGETLLLQPPPTAVPLSATILVGKPIGAAVRLTIPSVGTELYTAQAATPRHCLPFALDQGNWQAMAAVQNGFPTDTIVRWTHYATNGTEVKTGQVTIPGQGTTTVPIEATRGTGTLCLAADGPVAAVLIARSTPGLLVVQSAPAAAQRVDIPPRHITLGYYGQRQVLVHNPSAYDPVVLNWRLDGRQQPDVLVAPHGTWVMSVLGDWVVITSTDPVMINLVDRIGVNIAAVTPESTAAKLVRLPVIDVGQDGVIVSQIELTNAGSNAVQATLRLTDDAGKMLWTDKIWVEADGTTSKPFWYWGNHSRVLTIEALSPLTAQLLQREIKTTGVFHGIGLSLALVPGYAAAGITGALAANAALAAGVVLALYLLLRAAGVVTSTALGVSLLLAGSSPLAPAAVRLYAEVGGTLCLLLAVLAIITWQRGRWPFYVSIPLALLWLAGALVFHTRLIVLVAVIAGATAILIGRQLLRRTVGGGSPVRWLILAVGSVVMVAVILGGLLVASRFDPRLSPEYLQTFVRLSLPDARVFGILFGQASGLFPAVPVLFLAVGGFVWLIRRAPFLGWLALAVVVAQFLAVAVRLGGWETWGPPGRYIFPAVPFWGLALGAAWAWGFSRPVRWLATVLGVLGLLVTGFSWWLPLGLHFGIETGQPYWFTDVALQSYLGFNPFKLFPNLISLYPATFTTVLPWLGVLLVGALLSLRWTWRHTGLGQSSAVE